MIMCLLFCSAAGQTVTGQRCPGAIDAASGVVAKERKDAQGKFADCSIESMASARVVTKE